MTVIIKQCSGRVVVIGMGKSGLIGDFTALTDPYGNIHISEKTKETLDDDVQDILQSCMKEVRQILTEKRDLLEEFSQTLLKKEELEYDEIEGIFKEYGKVPIQKKKESPKK